MSLYTGKELAKEARGAFKAAKCHACPPRDSEFRWGRKFKGWKVQIVSGNGCAVIGFGKCANGHELSGACAL